MTKNRGRGVRFACAAALELMSAGFARAATDPAQLSAMVKTLACDAFEGRAPGTPGEARTISPI